MTFKLGIIGETGQLARALKGCCADANIEALSLNRAALDLAGEDESILDSLKAFKSVDAIINAAAYTAVDDAEKNQDTAYRVNANAPKVIAEFCNDRGVPFIHVSTDYVFNGQSQTPYTSNAQTDPLGVYGLTKLQGEDFIRKVGGAYAILRTSWVYDAVGKNFMTTMLRLAADRDALSVVNDQLGRPTYAKHLAQACLAAVQPLIDTPEDKTGTYHVSNTGSVISWADFAEAIFEAAKHVLPHSVTVTKIPSSEYPTPAKRPAYSVMDVTEFETQFNITLEDWSAGLEQAMSVWLQHREEV